MLCLLKRSYDRKHIAPIWTYLFSTRLTIEGFLNGIPSTTLDAQYQEMKGGGTGYEIYTHITDATPNIIERDYGAYLQDIRRAIQDLSLEIREKTQKPSTTLRSRAVPVPVSVAREPASVNGEVTSIRPILRSFLHYPSPYFTDNQTTTSVINKVRTHERVETPFPPVLSISTDYYNNQSRLHPLLLFRATPIVAHFRSRRHADPAAIIEKPSPFASQEFRQEVWPHLERDRRYLSPFISLAQNPRNALRRVEISR